MRTATASLALAMLALVAMLASGCAESQPKAADQVQEEIEETTDAKQASVDATLTAVRQRVSDFIGVGDGLESRIDGLKIKSELREIEDKLTSALEESGDKKVAAIEEISDAFENLIVRVETAADRAPADGKLQAELNDLATRMREAQAELGDAAAEYRSAQ